MTTMYFIAAAFCVPPLFVLVACLFDRNDRWEQRI